MRELGPHLTQCCWTEAYLRTKWHLDPSNHLATIHQCHRQKGQRSHSIGRTITCNGLPKNQLGGRKVITGPKKWASDCPPCQIGSAANEGSCVLVVSVFHALSCVISIHCSRSRFTVRWQPSRSLPVAYDLKCVPLKKMQWMQWSRIWWPRVGSGAVSK